MTSKHDYVQYLIDEAERNFKDEVYSSETIDIQYFNNVQEGFTRVRQMHRTLQMHQVVAQDADSKCSFGSNSVTVSASIAAGESAENNACSELLPSDVSGEEYSRLKAENNQLRELIIRMLLVDYDLCRKE